MKNILKKYNYIIQASISKMGIRVFLGIIFSLLWNKLANENKSYIITEKTVFFVGVFLLVTAWFNYLKLDGVTISLGKKRKGKGNISRFPTKNILDFLEEEVVDEDLYLYDETISSIIANLVIGVLFTIIGIIWSRL